MKKLIVSLVVVIMAISAMTPQVTMAYSYGDPNKDPIAEAYKAIVKALAEAPPNYETAQKEFATIEEELNMHMGKEPAKAVNAAFKKDDHDLVLEHMEQILVLNIARRLTNVEQNFKKYDVSKRLLAKGNATYEALSPLIKKDDAALDAQLRQQFAAMLTALGNPGLFGVGESTSDKAKFTAAKQDVLQKLQQQFRMKSVKVGHFSTTEPETTASAKKDWTDLSNIKNWIPLFVLVLVIGGAVVYYMKKRKG